MRAGHSEALAFLLTVAGVVAGHQGGDQAVHRAIAADQVPAVAVQCHPAADACPAHCQPGTPAPQPSAPWSASPPVSTVSHCWWRPAAPAACRPGSGHQSARRVTTGQSTLTHCHQHPPPCHHRSPSCLQDDWQCQLRQHWSCCAGDWRRSREVNCPVCCWCVHLENNVDKIVSGCNYRVMTLPELLNERSSSGPPGERFLQRIYHLDLKHQIQWLSVTKCIALRSILNDIKVSISFIEMQGNAYWFKFQHYLAMLGAVIYMHNIWMLSLGGCAIGSRLVHTWLVYSESRAFK